MSRLVGKQRDYSLPVVFLMILGIGIAGGLEYLGAIDFVSTFGPERTNPIAPLLPQTAEEDWN